MDPKTLKKKLSTYLSDAGQLRGVSEELLYEVLISWENWAGTSKDFYREIGFTQRQMASLIGKAKKLKRDGYFGNDHFKEIKVEGYQEVQGEESGAFLSSPMIEFKASGGSLIRFPQVAQLVEYLKQAS